ncbi:MAG: hypothetical protein ACMUIE_02325 [Thermoplasmatota archaeon]
MEEEKAIVVLVAIAIVITAGLAGLVILNHERNPYPFHPPGNLERFNFPEEMELNQTILESLEAAGSYLINHIQESGKWDYEYDPETDSNLGGYNLLRHAGTTYSLALIFKYTRDPDFYNGTISTLNYLLSRYMVMGEIDGKEVAYMVSNGLSKLGGAALTVLALVEVERMDPLAQYEKELDRLGEFMLQMQKEDGSFQCFYLDREDEHSNYYPGEALLAIARLYDHTQDNKYLTALESGFEYYNPYFGTGYTSYSPWGTEAMVYTYEWLKEDSYIDHCFATAESCRAGQNLPDHYEDPRLIGGWGSNPHASDASRVEAVVDSYLLAKRYNFTVQEVKYRTSMDLCASFLMELQFNEEESLAYPDPADVFGGTPLSYSEPKVRIDQVQHAVVVLVKVMVYQTSELNI